MSVYDMMTGGPHPLAGMWLAMLKINASLINRLRNVYLLEGSDPPVIYVLTRSESNVILEDNPRLIRQGQAFGGDTYWEFEFSVPDEYLEDVKKLMKIAALPRFEDHFKAMMAKLQGTPEEVAEDPEAQAMIERARPAFEAIVDKLKNGGWVVEV
jgi:hypothetical protein